MFLLKQEIIYCLMCLISFGLTCASTVTGSSVRRHMTHVVRRHMTHVVGRHVTHVVRRHMTVTVVLAFIRNVYFSQNNSTIFSVM